MSSFLNDQVLFSKNISDYCDECLSIFKKPKVKRKSLPVYHSDKTYIIFFKDFLYIKYPPGSDKTPLTGLLKRLTNYYYMEYEVIEDLVAYLEETTVKQRNTVNTRTHDWDTEDEPLGLLDLIEVIEEKSRKAAYYVVIEDEGHIPLWDWILVGCIDKKLELYFRNEIVEETLKEIEHGNMESIAEALRSNLKEAIDPLNRYTSSIKAGNYEGQWSDYWGKNDEIRYVENVIKYLSEGELYILKTLHNETNIKNIDDLIDIMQTANVAGYKDEFKKLVESQRIDLSDQYIRANIIDLLADEFEVEDIPFLDSLLWSDDEELIKEDIDVIKKKLSS